MFVHCVVFAVLQRSDQPYHGYMRGSLQREPRKERHVAQNQNSLAESISVGNTMENMVSNRY